MSCPFSTKHPSAFSPVPVPPLPQRICEVHSRNPGSQLEEQIEGARRRVTQLQLKIQQETGASAVSDGRRSQKGSMQAGWASRGASWGGRTPRLSWSVCRILQRNRGQQFFTWHQRD